MQYRDLPPEILDTVAEWFIAIGPNGLKSLLKAPGGRAFTLIILGVLLFAAYELAKSAWKIFLSWQKRRNDFWVEHFGRKATVNDGGDKRFVKAGAKLRWEWEISFKRKVFRRTVLKISEIDYSLDEMSVKALLPTIAQQKHLKFVDARIRKGVIYLYKDRFSSELWLDQLPPPTNALNANIGIYDNSNVLSLDFEGPTSFLSAGKSGTGKSTLAEAVNSSLRVKSPLMQTLVVTTKLGFEYVEALKLPNTKGVDPSGIVGKQNLVAELRNLKDRNERLKQEFSNLKIKHLKQHPLFGKDTEHSPVLLILDELFAYTRKKSASEKLEEEIIIEATELISEMLRQGRVYSVITGFISQTALSTESDIPLTQAHYCFSGATQSAEASRALFSETIAHNRSDLLKGVMIFRDQDNNRRVKIAKVRYG